MQNLKIKVEGSKMLLEVDLSKNAGFSKSKKNILIASTNGNMGYAYGDGIKLGINIYKINPEYKGE